MKIRSFRPNKRNQSGVTLLELLIVIALIGILAFGLTGAVYQFFTVNAQVDSQVSVFQQVNNAATWIKRDGEMAQKITVDPDSSSHLPVKIVWVEWETNTVNEITYSLEPNGNLNRSCLINGVLSSDIPVSRQIDPTSTNCRFENNTLIFTITAAEDGLRPAKAKRIISVFPKSGS